MNQNKINQKIANWTLKANYANSQINTALVQYNSWRTKQDNAADNNNFSMMKLAAKKKKHWDRKHHQAVDAFDKANQKIIYFQSVIPD